MQQWFIHKNHSLCDSKSHILVLFWWIVQTYSSHLRELSLITIIIACMIPAVSCVWFQTSMSVKAALITAQRSWSVRTQPARSAAVPRVQCGEGFIQDAIGSCIGETAKLHKHQSQGHHAGGGCSSCLTHMWPWTTKPVKRVNFWKLICIHHLKGE